MLKRILLAGAASVFIGGAAKAADIIEPMAYEWTGPYVGLQGGYAWGENDVEVDGEPLPLITTLSADSDPVTLVPGDDGSIGVDGWLGGLHLGYLWQHDSFVFGIEGDAEFADIDGDTDVFFSRKTTTRRSARSSRKLSGWPRCACALASPGIGR